jgi:hypothetical protein
VGSKLGGLLRPDSVTPALTSRRSATALLIAVAAFSPLLAHVPTGSAQPLPSHGTPVLLTHGKFIVAGTRISCVITEKLAVVCSTSVSSDPASNLYSIALSGRGTLVVVQFTVLGRSVVYSRGPQELPGSATGGKTVTLRSGAVVLIGKTGLGCSIGTRTLTCASRYSGRTPAKGSYGFVERSDGSASALLFRKPTKTLYAGRAQQPDSHNRYALNLGDSIGVTGTGLVCAVFRIAGVPAIVCETSAPGSPSPIENSYVTAVYADGRVEIARWANGAQTTVFNSRGAGGATDAAPGPTQAAYSGKAGDAITVRGTSIGCNIRSFESGGKQHAYIVCGPDIGPQGPEPNGLLGTLDEDGIAVVSRVDKNRNSTVIFERHP